MKVLCKKCHKDYTSDIVATFSNFHVGYVKCDNCQKENQRYVCESDLWLYYIFSSFIYYFGLLVIVFSLMMESFIMTIIVIAISMILLYKILIYGILYIYNNGPFNNAIKDFNYKQSDDALKLAKSQNLVYILLIFMISANASTLIVSVGMFIIMISIGIYKFIQARNKEVLIYKHKL